MFLWVHSCMYVHYVRFWCSQKPDGSLYLELQMVVSYLLRSLGSRPVSYLRAVNTLLSWLSNPSCFIFLPCVDCHPVSCNGWSWLSTWQHFESFRKHTSGPVSESDFREGWLKEEDPSPKLVYLPRIWSRCDEEKRVWVCLPCFCFLSKYACCSCCHPLSTPDSSFFGLPMETQYCDPKGSFQPSELDRGCSGIRLHGLNF